jgi:hypothetical protein
MKPKGKDYIPFYGFYSYFKKYFSGEKRDADDALRATYFEMYQIVISVLLAIPVLLLLFGIKAK